jgi:hypothetical protein
MDNNVWVVLHSLCKSVIKWQVGSMIPLSRWRYAKAAVLRSLVRADAFQLATAVLGGQHLLSHYPQRLSDGEANLTVCGGLSLHIQVVDLRACTS